MINVDHISRLVLQFFAIAALVSAGGCVRENVTGSIGTSTILAAVPHTAPTENNGQIQARPGQTRVALLSTPAPSKETHALTEAMARMLTLNGFFLVTAPDAVDGNEDLYFIAPDFNVTPGENGQPMLEVAWIIANSSGDTLGKVAQRRQIESVSNTDSWERTSALGAAAAAEGVSRIIREQRDL